MGTGGFQCWILLVLALGQAHATRTDETVATPDTGLKLELGQGRSQVVTAPGSNDVTVAGVIYSGGNVHTAQDLVSERSIRAHHDIRAKKMVVAREGLETAGTLNVGKKITALAEILAKKDIVTEGNLKAQGELIVQLATDSHGLINARKGLLSGGIVRSAENVVSEKSVIATALLQSDGGVFTKGSINAERRIVAKGDIHTESLMTAKEGFVTPGNVISEKLIKAGGEIRADGKVFGLGIDVGTEGIASKGRVHGFADVSSDGFLIGKQGIKTGASIVAEQTVTGSELISKGKLQVKSGAKVGDTLDVVGHTTLASATVQGQLYVGNKAIGDLFESMSSELAQSKLEMATMRATLEELTEMMKQK